MKYFVFLIIICSSCNTKNDDSLNKGLEISGFNKDLWKFDSLACYPKYRRQQAYIIKSNKGKFVNYKAGDIEKILGKPFRIELSNNIFSYSYLISNEYCCETIYSKRRERIEQYGLGAANLRVSFNRDDSIFYDIIIGIP